MLPTTNTNNIFATLPTGGIGGRGGQGCRGKWINLGITTTFNKTSKLHRI